MTPAEARSLKVGDRVVWRTHGCKVVGTVAAIAGDGVDITFDDRSYLSVPYGSEEWLGLDVDVSGRKERKQ